MRAVLVGLAVIALLAILRYHRVGIKPAIGESFYLDGFWYTLGPRFPMLEGTKVVIWRLFLRPDGGEMNARYQANFNYKLSGQCRQPDLIWASPTKLIRMIVEQSHQLANGNPLRMPWAVGACEAQLRDLATHKGTWVLPGRVLLKPTVVTRSRRTDQGVQFFDEVILPETAAQCREVAERLLRHEPIEA